VRQAVLLLLLIPTLQAQDPRTEVLQALFPNLDIVATTRHRDDSTKDFPDALAAEPIYQLNGPPLDETERCAAAGTSSRELRLQTYPWPRTRNDLIAVTQYRFIAATPALSCASVPLLAHLTRRGLQWEVVERRLLPTTHHAAIAGIQLTDLTGDQVPELLLELVTAGAGAHMTALQIYDLSGRRLRQILQTQSRLDSPDDRYLQTLDIPASLEKSGRAICFELTQFVRDSKTYSRPRTTHECYPTGM
jgi:hypothetical protein